MLQEDPMEEKDRKPEKVLQKKHTSLTKVSTAVFSGTASRPLQYIWTMKENKLFSGKLFYSKKQRLKKIVVIANSP